MSGGRKIKVLDHGYVQLIDYMGHDEAIIEAARMSTGRGFVSWEAYRRCVAKLDYGHHEGVLTSCDIVQGGELRRCEYCGNADDWQDFPRGDLGMLEFMYKNKHSTPFEFGELHIEVQAPIMVFREWHRHRTQAYSEFSARYSQMPNLHYLPELERVQKQSATNKQSSGDPVDEGCAQSFLDMARGEQEGGYSHYDMWVNTDGIAKEVARLNTPVSRYSKMRAKTDLRNWLAFLQLRMAPNAQWEIRQYANAVAETVKGIWPHTYALFEEHDLYGERLSRTEVAALRRILHSAPAGDQTALLWKRFSS